jgi:hypothetical protein
MLFRTLILHYWRSLWRSPLLGRRIAATIVSALGVLYFVSVLVALGFFLDDIVHESKPHTDVVGLINQYLLIGTLVLTIIRFLTEKTIGIELRPYLHLPFSRQKLVNSALLISLASPFTLLPLAFLLPFFIENVAGIYPSGAAVIYGIGLLLLVGMTQYGAIMLLAAFGDRPLVAFIGAAVFALLLFIPGWLELWSPQDFSSFLFNPLLTGNPLPLIAVALSITLLYWQTAQRLTRSIINDTSTVRKRSADPTQSLSRFEGRGQTFDLILLELRLIFRNKRPRYAAIISALVIPYVLIGPLSKPDEVSNFLSLGLTGMFTTGIFVLNYGQLMFSWESNYFDLVLTRIDDPRQLIRAKLLLLQLSCLVLYIPATIIFAIFQPSIIAALTAFLFYNAGVTSLLILLIALFNRKRINLGRTTFMNYEGFSVVHWLGVMLLLFGPEALFWLLGQYVSYGLIGIAVLGIIGLLLTPVWTRSYTKLFIKRKYLMAEGFRE